MTILWRYLISHYLKVLFFCVISFIAILVTTRLDEIASFATLGASGSYVFKFALYQIPYILPIAVPISCLISSFILFQRLSSSHELTAMRACGLALKQITGPILLAGAYLSVINFYTVSELSTQSHLKTKQLIHEIKTVNPLLLLHNERLLKTKGAYAAVQGPIHGGDSAEDVIMAISNTKNKRINLALSKKVLIKDDKLIGEGVTFISGRPTDDLHKFDHLVLENMGKIETSLSDFSLLSKKEGWRLKNDHLKLPLLIIHTYDKIKNLQKAKSESLSSDELRPYRIEVNKCFAEISRRISAAFSAFSFTLIGVAFGISISRQNSKKGVIYVIGLAAMYLTTFFFARSIDYHFYLATLLYIVPHIIIITICTRTLRNASRGIE